MKIYRAVLPLELMGNAAALRAIRDRERRMVSRNSGVGDGDANGSHGA